MREAEGWFAVLLGLNPAEGFSASPSVVNVSFLAGEGTQRGWMLCWKGPQEQKAALKHHISQGSQNHLQAAQGSTG